MSTLREHWVSEVERSDGITVRKLADQFWVLDRRGLTINRCPCCGRQLETAHAARLVADALFPPDAGHR